MKMQMLVVLAVAALVPSLSEGRILSKCELKNLLEKAALKFNLTGKAGVKNLTNKDFVAQIVCHVEKASGFNTSFVTDGGPDVLPTRPAKVNDRHRPEPPPKRGKRHAGDDVHPTHTANNDNNPTRLNHPTPPTHPTRPEPPPKRGKRHAGDDVHPTHTANNDNNPTRLNHPTPPTHPTRPEPPPKRGKRHAGDDVHPTHTANNDNHPTHPNHPTPPTRPNIPTRPNHPTRLTLPTRPEQPPKRGKRHAGNPFTSGEDNSSEEETVGTLYGLFQLSDHVICSSGSTPSLNLCQMNCSALIDDDISDDLNCVETIKQTMESGRGQQTMALKRMIKLLFQKECLTTVASSYFSKC